MGLLDLNGKMSFHLAFPLSTAMLLEASCLLFTQLLL